MRKSDFNDSCSCMGIIIHNASQFSLSTAAKEFGAVFLTKRLGQETTTFGFVRT